MFNFFYWTAFIFFCIWGIGGLFALIPILQKGEIVSLIICSLITITPIYLLIVKKVWIKSKWESIFGSQKDGIRNNNSNSTKKTEAKEKSNSEKAFYCFQLLTYVAMTDDEITSIDKEIIAKFIRDIFSENETLEALSKLNKWGSPTELSELNLNESLDIINKLCSRDERRKIVDACRNLIRSDGKINNVETSVFGLIRRKIYPTELGGLLSTKCDNCKSDKCETVSQKEIDRWIARKEVIERLETGKTRMKNVSITKVKIRYDWICRDCYSQWYTTDSIEKK